MSIDPFSVLGLADDSDDEAIRKRYLELVRAHPPERDRERFTAIRAAYEKLRDADTRLHHRLFNPNKGDTIEAVLKEMACQSSRRRLSLKTMINALHSNPK